jgi:hypothetical protein
MANEATREQKEAILLAALNKADKSRQGFFLYHLTMYVPGPGKIRDMVMSMDGDDFDLFYSDALSNLEAPNAE